MKCKWYANEPTKTYNADKLSLFIHLETKEALFVNLFTKVQGIGFEKVIRQIFS